MRCVALAQACIAEGMEARFLARVESRALADLIVQSGCQLAVAPEFGSAAEDARAILRLARAAGGTSDCAIVDGYQFDAACLEMLAGAQLRLAVIDDLAALERYPADLIVNQNLDANPGRYRTKAGCRLLLGPGYALLRPEFAAWMGWRRPVADVATRVLVTLGGGVTAEVGSRVLEALAGSKGSLEIRLLSGLHDGPAGPLDAAARTARAAGHQVSVLAHTSDMPREMTWADIAIAGGGSTVWELAFMQTPSLLLVLADNQSANVAGLARLGFGIDLGEASALDATQLAQAVDRLRGARGERDEMARIGRKLVDGRGAHRVARAIRELAS